MNNVWCVQFACQLLTITVVSSSCGRKCGQSNRTSQVSLGKGSLYRIGTSWKGTRLVVLFVVSTLHLTVTNHSTSAIDCCTSYGKDTDANYIGTGWKVARFCG